jgi:hypothetical protein
MSMNDTDFEDLDSAGQEAVIRMCDECTAQSKALEYAEEIPKLTKRIADLEAKLADATKAGTPYAAERDAQNALVLRVQQAEAKVKELEAERDLYRSMLTPEAATLADNRLSQHGAAATDAGDKPIGEVISDK